MSSQGPHDGRCRRYALALVIVLMGVACKSSPTAPITVECPTILTIVSGDNQRAAPGTALPSMLEVHADVDPRYRSMFCVGFSFSIAWSVEAGGGSIRPSEVSGQIQSNYTAAWTLGPAPGAQTVRATIRGSEQHPAATVVFRAVAESPQ